ncbi:MAG: O-antigen ligase family protein [Deltaproteobacteria bacterium]|nr:O-antigen ligase family protein [Deltaproteobacteria bacterium]
MRSLLSMKPRHEPGQSTLQLIAPLLVLLVLLVAFSVLIPSLSPLNMAALLAALVVFVVSFASTEIALFVLIFSMLLSPEFVIGTTEGASLGRGITLRVDDLLLVIIGFSWLARMSINKELGLFLRTPLNKPIAYYITVCLVSTLFGVIFGRVDLKTGFLFVLKYFEYMIVYFMAANHLQHRKQIQTYLWAMLLTCAVVSLIAMGNIPGGGRISAPFEGEIGEPNTFGGYLILMISVAAGLFLSVPSLRSKIFSLLLICLFAVPLFYTQSRSSYLAAVPAVMTLVFLSEKKRWMVPVVLMLGLALPIMAPDTAKERVRYTFVQGKNRKDVVAVGGVKLDTSTSARLMSWQEASRDWIRHPFLGFGVTGYRFLDAQYVRVITETGFLGLFFFFVLMATIFREVYRAFRQASDPLHRGLAMGFLAGFVGLLFHGIGANTFIIVRIMEPFWFLAALVIISPSLERKEKG